MTHVSVQDFEANTADLLQRIRGGEELILEDNGVPFGKVTPIAPALPVKRDVRKRIGFLDGQGSFPENWKEIGQEDMEAATDRLRL